MKRLLKPTLKTLEFVGYALQLVLVFLFAVSLLEWWGALWFSIVCATPLLILPIITVVYRLLSGTWTDVFIWIGGLFSGFIGLLLVSLAMLSYPVIYRVSEGNWPTTYLAIWGILVMIVVITQLYKAATTESQIQ